MKKEITVGQLLSVSVTILITIITGWITMSNKVSSHGTQLKSVEKWQTRVEIVMDKMDSKSDRIESKIDKLLSNKESK
jgi:hypothetical protein